MHRLHTALFVLFLLAWTIALWSPVPQERARDTLGTDWHVYLFGKGLHVSAYAFLTVLGASIRRLNGRWPWVLAGLVAHAILTEIFQPYVGRTGSVRDVGLDCLGVAIGGAIILIGRRVRASSRAARDRSGSFRPDPLPSARPIDPSPPADR